MPIDYSLPRPVYDYREHIVPGIMPSREVHLICGPPGIGKTTLCLDLLPAIERGDLILGYSRAIPTKSVFVSCDRSEGAHLRRLDSLGIPHAEFPFFSGLDIRDDNDPLNIEKIISSAAKHFPDHPLVFIDGMASLIEDTSNYRQAQQLLRETTKLCYWNNRTVIGSVHSPKAKEGQSYTNPREQILGSQAWSGFSDLVIAMQPAEPKDPANNRRLVHVCTRSAAGDFTVKMILTGGRLMIDDSIERELYSLLEEWLKKQDHTRIIPTREIILYGVKECSLYERAIERWIEEKVEEGVLDRVARGKYRRKLQA
jgi:hypothetical protein